jgi:hypothetical protein
VYNVAQCRIFTGRGHWQISNNSEATPAGSDQEPTWLKNCDQSLEEDTPYEPEGDQDALAKVSDLVFEPTRFQLDLQLNNEGNSRIFEFEDKNDIMVALTWLCWR